MPWFAPSSSHAVSFSRWRSLLRTAIVSGMLAGSLSACVPLVIGGVVGGLLLATDRRTSASTARSAVARRRKGICAQANHV